jgi:hypothetical protein
VAITDTVQGHDFVATARPAADAPMYVRLTGPGKFGGLGPAGVARPLDLGGFRRSGMEDAGGTPAQSKARGTVELQRTGSGGFAEVPNGPFVTPVSKVKGTGAFAGFR